LIDANAAVDVVDDIGNTALMWACGECHYECAQALIDAGAAVDEVNNGGQTALMSVCDLGDHECAQALIDAGAAVDVVDSVGRTAQMYACQWGHHECARALIDVQADLELTDRDRKNALMLACEKPRGSSLSAGKAACALALLESMVPIREIGVADQTASLKCTCERHQVLQVVLTTRHIIEFAPAALVRASVHVSDVHSIIVDFARDMLIQRQLANLALGGLAIVDSSTSAVRAPIEAHYSY
jgi:hypothetical protein